MAITFHCEGEFSFPGELNARDDVPLINALRNEAGPAINSTIPDPPCAIVASILAPDHFTSESLLECGNVIPGFFGPECG
jgi:hypothetical protein